MASPPRARGGIPATTGRRPMARGELHGRASGASGASVGPAAPLTAYAPVRPPIRRTAAEAVAFLRQRSVLADDPALPRGQGRPVLVLPVLGRGDRHTVPMRGALERLGYRPFGWGLGTNAGPTPRLLAGVEHRLLALHAEHGPLDLVGFSLGGVFARLLAHRHPDKVRQVATVCSPFREIVDSAFLPLRPFLRAWGTPDLPDLAAEASRPLPVPGTFLFSRTDGIVAWESCIEPSRPEDCFEVPGPHVGIGQNPAVLAILACRLGRDLSGEAPSRG
ncbi:esterase/lipase family protein [Roseomonas sp. BN140053]|uniref:esterase/lipase family protein n=1 Tax=Roseomonas sp. BN140053 TaxID=3391898 RepID=UPI0039E86182